MPLSLSIQQQSNARHHPARARLRERQVLDGRRADSGRVHAVVMPERTCPAAAPEIKSAIQLTHRAAGWLNAGVEDTAQAATDSTARRRRTTTRQREAET
jgi:hypothetical protein